MTKMYLQHHSDSHQTALNSANEAKAIFQELIGDPDTSSPIKKQVTKLLVILVTIILPLSEKYAEIMCSPPQCHKRQIAEVDEEDEKEESTAKTSSSKSTQLQNKGAPNLCTSGRGWCGNVPLPLQFLQFFQRHHT